ncbi:hypothetical protein [Ferruginibacter sp.]
MKKIILFKSLIALLLVQEVIAQDCKTNTDLDATPGKYLTAAQYPWPAVRAEYYNKMTGAADKATAKQILTQLEKIEQQSRNGFTLTGGNWENYYSTEGYNCAGAVKLGQYTFQSALYEYFCVKGKSVRNSEYSTVLRMYANNVQLNTLEPYLTNPFGSSMGGTYDLGFQYMDWKNHKLSEPNAQLISLFTYLSCNSASLVDAINSGKNYFQDVAEKDIRPNNRSNYVYRYWFIKNKAIPVLIPVTRKEYLQSLLEYYEREKLYFPKLVTKLTDEHDNGVKQYSNWQADVEGKIAVVKKVLSEQKEDWLNAQAVINRIEDGSKNYKAGLTEKTNYNRFWTFYGSENKSVPLYKYNPEYFKTITQNPAKPQIITIAFRYITVPSSLRLLNNFTENFDFEAVKKLVQ